MSPGGRSCCIYSALRTGASHARGRLRVLDCVRFGQRARGLIGRPTLRRAVALRLANCIGVHTFGMRMPIDVAISDRLGRVCRTVAALAPNRLLWCGRSAVVWELRAGELRRLGIGPGTRIAAPWLSSSSSPRCW